MKNAFLFLSLISLAVAVSASTAPVANGTHCFAMYDRCLSCTPSGECAEKQALYYGEAIGAATSAECENAARDALAEDDQGLYLAHVSFRASPDADTVRSTVLRPEMCKTVHPR